MTIKELIQHLQRFDENLPVMLSGYEGGVYEANRIRPVVFAINVNTDWYNGPHELVVEPDEYPSHKKQQGVYLV